MYRGKLKGGTGFSKFGICLPVMRKWGGSRNPIPILFFFNEDAIRMMG